MTILLVTCTVITLASVTDMQTSGRLQSLVRSSDPAVDAYARFLSGIKLKFPVDQRVIIGALDRLVSAVGGVALGQPDVDDGVLSAAHRLRREIRQLQPWVGDAPAQIKRRWRVFQDIAALIDELARELGPRGATPDLRAALLRAADSLDYDDPLRWQPPTLEIFFNLALKALKQMADGTPASHPLTGRDGRAAIEAISAATGGIPLIGGPRTQPGITRDRGRLDVVPA